MKRAKERKNKVGMGREKSEVPPEPLPKEKGKKDVAGKSFFFSSNNQRREQERGRRGREGRAARYRFGRDEDLLRHKKNKGRAYDPELARFYAGHPFRWMLALLLPIRRRYFFAIMLDFAAIFLSFLPPLAVGRFIDRVLLHHQYDKIWCYSLMLAGAPLLRALLSYTYRILFESSGQYAMLRLRDALYAKMQHLDADYFHRYSTGSLMAKFTGDLNMLRFYWSWSGWTQLEQLCMFIFGAVYLLLLNWKLTLACMLMMPLLACQARIFGRKISPLWGQIRAQFERLNAVVQENITANRVVRAFVRQDYETGRFEKENAAYRDAHIERVKTSSIYLPMMEAFSGIVTIPIILFGGWLVIRGELTVGELVSFSGLLYVLENPMRMLGFQINDLQHAVASAEKLLELLTTRCRITAPEEDRDSEGRSDVEREEEIDRQYRASRLCRLAARSVSEEVHACMQEGGTELKEKMRGSIRAENVSFAYPDRREQLVLKKIHFSVEAGERIGLIGATGSGKSSLLRLLSRLYDPTEGRIFIDGRDVKEWNLHDLRRQIAVVSQEVFLFSDSVEGNIAFAEAELPLEKVVGAARLAEADSFIRRLESSYDTVVGERGVGLSGGQRQRLALARALAASAKILILDDTTSALDMETERRIRENLDRIREAGQTCVMVAQRISSLRDCDQIYVFDDGQIVERGNHEELVALGGIYCEIYRSQKGDQEKVLAELEGGRSNGSQSI